MKGKLFIISAPSGAGKTTLIHRVLKELKNEIALERVVTYTTKEPIAGEREGHDYHFVSREAFDQLLAQGFFMEHSKAYVDYYGSPASVLQGLSQGISYILIVDRVGAQDIIKKVPDAVSIWIEAPSLEILKERLVGRGTESPDKVKRRLLRARQEMELEKNSPFYTYHMINNELDKAVFQLKAILRKEILEKRLNFPLKNAPLGIVSDNAF